MNLLFVLKRGYCNLLSVTVYRSCITSTFLKLKSSQRIEHNTSEIRSSVSWYILASFLGILVKVG